MWNFIGHHRPDRDFCADREWNEIQKIHLKQLLPTVKNWKKDFKMEHKAKFTYLGLASRWLMHVAGGILIANLNALIRSAQAQMVTMVKIVVYPPIYGKFCLVKYCFT